MCYSKLREFREARQAYEEAIRLDPSNPETYLRIGLDLSASGRSSEAIGWLDQAHAKATDRVDISYALAEELIHAGNYERARDLLSSAMTHEPNEALLLEALGDLYARQHREQDAVAAYRRTLRLEPPRVSARLSLAGVYLELRQTDDAKAELNEVLRAEPQNAEAKAQLGRIALEAGEQRAASELIEQALAADPDNRRANEELAQIRMREGKLSQAQAILEKLVNMDPKNPRFHYLLSRVLLKLERAQEAQSEFELSKQLEGGAKQLAP
jgi:predicted Zn-dependent protease